jgi:hypothetical protein
MTSPRLVLAIDVAAFGLFGLAYMFWPDPFARLLTGSAPASPNALTDVRAIYGGLALGLTTFFWLAYRGDTSLQRLGLTVSAFAFGFCALGRTLGIALDGSATAVTYASLAAEALVAAWSAFAVRRAMRTPATA